MCRKQLLEPVQSENILSLSISRSNKDYNPRQISSMIKRYQELRSVVEVTAIRHERAGGGGQRGGKEEIICALVDIDEGMNRLPSKQRIVIGMLKKGYKYEDISYILGVSVSTVKFHARQGIFHLTTYLNSH